MFPTCMKRSLCYFRCWVTMLAAEKQLICKLTVVEVYVGFYPRISIVCLLGDLQTIPKHLLRTISDKMTVMGAPFNMEGD